MHTHPKAEKIKILLADDHLVVRMGIASVLSYEKDMSIVGEADTGREAIALSKKLNPDVVIMDLMMPVLSGADATAELQKLLPQIKILVLTSYGSSPDIQRALNVGARGALLKSSSKDEITSAIRKIHAGESVICPEIANTLKAANSRPALSDRQVEVLNLAAKGFSNNEIARILGISVNSVKDHFRLIFSRLNVSTRTEATSLALNLNLIKG